MVLEKSQKRAISGGIEIFSGLFIILSLVWELGWSGLHDAPHNGSWLFWIREIILFLLALNIIGIIGEVRYSTERTISRRKLGIQLIIFSCAIILLIGGLFYAPLQTIGSINLRRIFCLLVGLISLLNLKDYIQQYFLQSHKKNSKTPPALIFLISLIGVILVGGTLLLTPQATIENISPVDAFFLSTSAVCVTGLVPLDISTTLTDYGKIVLLGLFQIGALGVMTFTYFISILIGRGLSLRQRVNMGFILDEEGISKAVTFVKSIIILTFLVELFGTLGLWFSWKDVPILADKSVLWYAFFHSVSGFCNAGFSLFPDNFAEPAIANNRMGQAVILVLVFCGGLGFAVYLELVQKFHAWYERPKEVRLLSSHWSTHSYLVLRMSLILIIGGSLLLWLIDSINNPTNTQAWFINLWESFFYSIARTAGINITDTSLFSVPYALIICILMFIGGNPGSTTGGVHTTVFAVACGEIYRILTGQKDVEFHHRRIARTIVERACITVIIAGIWVCLTAITLSLVEPQFPLVNIVFEVISSFATVGFSMGITDELSSTGKILIIANMIIGRIGMLSFLLALMGNPNTREIRYPETHLPLN